MRICLNRVLSWTDIWLGQRQAHMPGVLPTAVKLSAPEAGKQVSGNQQAATSSLRQLANLNHSA